MKKRWSPLKTALLWCLLVFVLALVTGGVYAGVANVDPEKSGEMVGRALLPVLVLTGIVAYAVQKSRRAEKK
jgi:Na+/H+-dicarboxylate symporter